MFKITWLVFSSLILMGAAQAQELDPTKPFTQLTLNNDNINQHFILYSIIQNGHSKSAIINNETLEIGEKIGEYTVENIEPNHVKLTNSKETIELSLFSNDLIK